MELEIGKKVYIPVYERNSKPSIKEAVITKIGKKYFYLNNDEKNHPVLIIDNTYHCKNYSQYNFTVYESEKEITDIWDLKFIAEKISKFFSWSGNYKHLTIDQLKEIERIIES